MGRIAIKLALIILLLALPVTAHAACTGSSPTWTATPDFASVSSCVSQISAGDTVNVSAGSVTWTSPLVITKGMTLQGAGPGNTIIVNNIAPGAGGQGLYYTHMIRYSPASPELNEAFRVTGFEFHGGGGINNNDSGGIWIRNASTTNVITNVRIDHNYFHDFPNINGYTPRCVRWGTYAYGVIDNNDFVDCYKTADFGDQSCQSPCWASIPFEQGTANQTYVEDNSIVQTGTYSLGGITSGGDGGRYVYRHNTLYADNSASLTVWDAHGDKQNGWGTVGTEIYDNTFYFTGSDSYWYRGFYIRGGTNLIYNNKLYKNNANANLVHLIEEGGVNSPAQDVKNTFIWNNKFNDVVNDAGGVSVLSGTRQLVEGTDFWSDDGGDVSAGLDASKPGTCTNDTYYGTIDTGKYYKCVSSSWVLQYTAYTYPHPLRGEVSDYYIDGTNGNDQNSGTLSQPWKTITKANSTLTAGDIVYIKAGTYIAGTDNYIKPANSGSSVNRITYRNYGTDVVTIQQGEYGVHLDGKDYITVQGLNFSQLDRFLYIENDADHNIIAYCNFDQVRNIDEWVGSRIWKGADYNWIHHCRFSQYGICTGTPPSGSDNGAVLEIGWESGGATYVSQYNLLENNTMFHGGHHVLGVHGKFNIIRNNYLYNDAWTNNRGNRVLYMVGASGYGQRNLIEGNRIGYSAPPCDSISSGGANIASSYNIVRYNSFYHNDVYGLGHYAYSEQDIEYNKVYNNTFFNNAYNPDPGADPDHLAAIFFQANAFNVRYNVYKNNLYYSHDKIYGYDSSSNPNDQTYANNWGNDSDSVDPLFVDASITPPEDKTDSTLPDLNLQSGSSAIDAGGSLATITSASGSGTSFVVDDAGYFMDGWGVVQGDMVQLEGTTQTAYITSIDYQTDTITVDSSLNWTQNQGVGLAYEGFAPDAGGYEYMGAITPPIISNPLPSGILGCTSNPRAVTLSVETSVSATCKYDTSDIDYFSMSETFFPIGGTSHNQSVSDLYCGALYLFYVRCNDGQGHVNQASIPISFSIEAQSSINCHLDYNASGKSLGYSPTGLTLQ